MYFFLCWYYSLKKKQIKGGKVKDGVNKEGVQFYKALIDELIAKGIYQSIN